jgi:CheY-specific phosphatase CheX
MKNKLTIAARYISLFFILAFGVVSIVGSGGSSGHGGDGAPPGTTINEDNIEEITHRILDLAFLGEGFEDEFGDLQIPEGDCLDGGTITSTGNISDPPAVDDTTTVTYNNCQEFGVITDGTMTLTITQVSDNFDGTPPYNLNIDIVLNDLSSEDVDLGLVSTTNGDMAIFFSENLAGDMSIMMQGNSLTLQWDAEFETLSDFLIELTTNWITGDYSLDLNGTIDSTLIGGAVSFNTTTNFTGNDNIGTGEPTAGVLHVTSSIDNSQALLTALADGVSLETKVDADGDGEYELVFLTPWAEL